MSQVIIGMGPHGRSATVEVMTSDETVVAGAGMPPTLPATGRCWQRRGSGRSGPGRPGDARASAGTSRTGC